MCKEVVILLYIKYKKCNCCLAFSDDWPCLEVQWKSKAEPDLGHTHICVFVVLQIRTRLCCCILNKRDLSEVGAAENPARTRQTLSSAVRRDDRSATVGCHHRLSAPASVPINPCTPATFSCPVGDVCTHLPLRSLWLYVSKSFPCLL